MSMSLTVRPSQKDYSKFGLLWVFAPNRAHEIFTGTKQECYDIQQKINADMKAVQIELKGEASPAYWVKGTNCGGSLEYNMNFETEREALNAAGDYLTRSYI